MPPMPRRHEEPAIAGGRSLILRKGFIGRRKELHRLRRDLRAQRYCHVVQGLGGLGKSAFCYEALKLYQRLGFQPLALWCAEVEDERHPVNAYYASSTTPAKRCSVKKPGIR